MMRSLKSVGEAELRWTQPRLRQASFELRAGDEVYATLQWTKAGGSLVAGETAEGRWTFKRVGFLNPRVTIRRAGEETDLATFRPSWKGDGTLRFADGRVFSLDAADFWWSEWSLNTADGRPLIVFRRDMGRLFRSEATVELKPEARDLPELPLLALLGWYVMILIQHDAGTSVVAHPGEPEEEQPQAQGKA
jgi:hypothetical protein